MAYTSQVSPDFISTANVFIYYRFFLFHNRTCVHLNARIFLWFILFVCTNTILWYDLCCLICAWKNLNDVMRKNKTLILKKCLYIIQTIKS